MRECRAMEWFELVLSLFVILGGAELFTNGIEWVGEGFGLSQGAVGSVLAAVGTALPETILPLIAILSGHVAGEEIGIGAILGAPFMLTTLAMFVIAVAVFGRPRHELPGTAEGSTNWPTFLQVAVALILIVGGARLFVDAVNTIADRFRLSHLVFALLVAPVATELPEKFNSVIWVRRRRDTLALGNMTGAMVFQSSFPVTVGLLLTPWHLAHEALVAGAIALAAGALLYLTIRLRGRFSAPLLLVQGGFYAAYVVYVLTRPGT